MDARILTQIPNYLTYEQIEDFVIGNFIELLKSNIFIYGFYYEKGVGIYTVGPREELNKLKNTNIEDFNFIEYIKSTDDELFWMVDYTNGPRLNRMVK